MLLRDTPVLARRRTVAAYLYAYTRILELACSWTMVVPNTAFKVDLGRKIGLDGLAIERLTRRVTQMYSTGSRGEAPVAYAQWLDAQCMETDEGRIATFLLATIDDLRQSMRRYVETAHAGDEPTRLLLGILERDLALGRENLAAYAKGSIEGPSVDSEGDTVAYAGTEPLLPIPGFPARPASFIRNAEEAASPKLSLEEAMTPSNMCKSFRRMYIEIEICAIEVCARNIIEYRSMPNAFKVDMSQQIWDEARHAELVTDVVHHFGGNMDALVYSGHVWTRHEMGDDLAERLAIEQLIQEGNSVDKAYQLLKMLRRFGHNEAAECMEWLTADETQHALIGNRWLLRLVEGDRAKYEAVLATANEKIKFPLSPVNRALREIAGYPEWYVDQLERQVEASKA
ncbi:MAG: DUF455 family protein [Deltaproteobacteria bacterium]|nr:DUF455 family protein [Deltaproteobacteria bacterium]